MKLAAALAIFIGIILLGCSNGEQTAIEQLPSADATTKRLNAAWEVLSIHKVKMVFSERRKD